MSGQVQANAKVLRERGPLATTYFGTMVLVGMVAAGTAVIGIAAILAFAFVASGKVYAWVAGIVVLILVLLSIWFALRMAQFLRASRAYRKTPS